MTLLDLWFFLPWMLYDATALRVLTAAAAALVVMSYSPRIIRA